MMEAADTPAAAEGFPLVVHTVRQTHTTTLFQPHDQLALPLGHAKCPMVVG